MKFILDEFDASVLYTFQSVCIYKAFQAVIFSPATNISFVDFSALVALIFLLAVLLAEYITNRSFS
jgi:hypothetical protein